MVYVHIYAYRIYTCMMPTRYAHVHVHVHVNVRVHVRVRVRVRAGALCHMDVHDAPA
jgi:hypothetical protein